MSHLGLSDGTLLLADRRHTRRFPALTQYILQRSLHSRACRVPDAVRFDLEAQASRGTGSPCRLEDSCQAGAGMLVAGAVLVAPNKSIENAVPKPTAISTLMLP